MKLRYYQNDAVKAAMKFLQTDSKSGVIAIPTGAGKSLVIADIVQKLINKKKVLILSHVKEILEQNKLEMERYIPGHLIPEGIAVYSSMLNRKYIGPITIAGVQSAYRKAELFSYFDVVIIDECHLVSDNEDSMYQKLLMSMDKAKVIGLTATPFRLGTGKIYGKGKQFEKMIYSCIQADNFVKLVNEGYLSNLTTKRTKQEMDTEGIKLIGGDFSDKDLSDRFDRDALTGEIVKEIMAAGKDRKSWLVFAIDMNHAEALAEVMIRNGIPTCVVHSKMNDIGFDRDKTIQGIKNGKYKCAISVNILTTGFNHPDIDLIAMARPTNSPTLHVQALGRGSRVSETKKNCLVLDFAGNTERLGPINNVLVKEKSKGKSGGDPIVKECPDCHSLVHVSVRKCPDCNHIFKFQHGLVVNDKSWEVIDEGGNAWLNVHGVEYGINKKFGSPSSIKVTYDCGADKITEWICILHKGFAKHKADNWVAFRGGKLCKTIDDFMMQKDDLAVPNRIRASKRGKNYVVTDAEFSTKTKL